MANRVEAPDGRGGPHVFVADLDRPELVDGDRHHLERALRLRRGDPFTASDGAGGWRPCRFGPEVEIDGSRRQVAPPQPVITVGFTPVKGYRPEWVVQKLTEVGADRIVVLRTDRSVVRWDGARAEGHRCRLIRIAREAAMQSRRCWLPELQGPTDLADLTGGPGVALAERGGGPPSLDRPMVLIGPEGGWSDEERDGRSFVGLGTAVLRAETAAVVAGSLLAALRSGILAPP